MFTSLTEKLGSIADRLKRQSTLRESDTLLALRDVLRFLKQMLPYRLLRHSSMKSKSRPLEKR